MARYLVTGAAGFIGSQVASQLLDQGHTVVAIDDLNTAYDVRLKHWRLDRLTNRQGFSFSRGDISDRVTVEALWRKFDGAALDGVINLAARAGVRQSLENPWVYAETNLIGTLNLLEQSRRDGVKKFVLASTSSLYGAINPRPFREDANTNQPLSPYAATKKAAEAMCYSYHHLYGADVTVLRYFTVYGPAGRPDMSLFRFVQRIREGKPITVYGDGTQQRDFTFVEDIARGTVAALKPLGYDVINLGSDHPVVLNDAIALVERLTGKTAQVERLPMHIADIHDTWADVSRAKEKLNWEAQVSFEDGVRRLAEWYEQERSWAAQISTE
jgi:nucleoside-diphosphate-sugar epimerase